MRPPNPRQVAALVYDGLAIFEFGIVAEVFGLPRTGLNVQWYTFEVCSFERGPLRATGGIRVESSHGLASLRRAGTIVIPGWTLEDKPPPPEVIRALRSAHAAGARLVSICSGVFLLAATGLLDGKRATTHWRHVERFKARFPQIQIEPNVLYVDEGKILTSAGSAAGIDLCLHIVRCDYGAEIANQVARRLVIPPHREGGQAQYIEIPICSSSGGSLAPVLEWAQSSLSRSLRVEDMARQAAMSPRTFARQFRQQTGTTPHQWLTHLRVIEAQRQLEKSGATIDRIAESVGLQTAATLRHHFQRLLGTPPNAYRRQFALPTISPSTSRT